MRQKIAGVLAAVLLFCNLVPAAAAAESGTRAVSEAGLDMIAELEGFSGTAYQSGSQWYIGYGTSCGADEYPDGITREEALELLRDELSGFSTSLSAWAEDNGVHLSQTQFDAMLSFTYNLGRGWMTTDCSLVDLLLDNVEGWSDLQVVNAFGSWCHSGGEVVSGLVQRRLTEACLFLYGEYDGQSAGNFVWLILDEAGGLVQDDIVFYEKGQPYGSLPAAERTGYTFSGWQDEAGRLLSAADTAQESRSVTATWTEAPWDNPFSDVAETSWYYEYVKELSRDGLVAGYPDGTFGPDDPVTLGAALTLILGVTGYEPLTSDGSHWAAGYLARALDEGLLDSSQAGDLDGAVSRLLIAQVTAKALGLSPAAGSSPFSDTADGCVLALYQRGILQGSYQDGQLVYRPDSGITRAELCVILHQLRTADLHAGQLQYGSYWVDILEDVPVSRYDPDAFFITSDGRIGYSGAETRTGIDVSVYQGDIDWEAVKADGIDFAIIRLGFRGYGSEGSMNLDRNFQSNLEGAISVGLDVGVYFFSQAIAPEEAAEEAEFVLSYLDGYELTYPVVFDWEVIGQESARTYGLDTETLCACANTFCSMVEEAGYRPMIYFNSYAGYVKYDLSQVLDYDFWFAQYSQVPTFYYDFQMWQYSSQGRVDGISGDVDLNLSFVDYAD